MTVKPQTQWLMLQPPLWMPFAWWALLVGSVIASMVGDPGAVCTVDHPCEADAVFPMVVTVMGVAVVAFWWEPVAAFVGRAGCGALGVMLDPSTAGRTPASSWFALA